MLLPRTRAKTPAIVLTIVFVAGAIVAFVMPSLGGEILKVTRLSGGNADGR